MAAIVTVRVYGACNLPIMDHKRNTTDAYVSVEIQNTTEKRETKTCKGTRDPVWDQTFRFTLLEDSALFSHPVRLTVMDQDTFSANDQVGVVIIGLDALLTGKESERRIAGWFPIYDTLRGINGQLYVQIRVQRVTGATPMFFSASAPEGFEVVRYHGLVDELQVSADPEHQWHSYIRGARPTNEKRQLLFYKMAGQVKQSVGDKAAAQFGANAVIAYRFDIDFEGSHGVIARGYGTACTIAPIEDSHDQHDAKLLRKLSKNRPKKSKAKSRGGGPREAGSRGIKVLTLDRFPEGLRFSIGGAVSARSVKLITGKQAKQEVRDQWWSEVREEVREHARAMQCTHITGYCETTTVYEDICILSVSGTAIRVWGPKGAASPPNCFPAHIPYSRRSSHLKGARTRCRACQRAYVPEILLCTVQPPSRHLLQPPSDSFPRQHSTPVRDRGFGMAPPFFLRGSRQLVESRVCRPMPKLQGETKAGKVSELVLFLQFDVYRQLIYKLRVLGLNAAFGLRVQISLGEGMIAAVATATACYACPLPPPAQVRISRHIGVKDTEDAELVEMQRKIIAQASQNRAFWQARVAELTGLRRSQALTLRPNLSEPIASIPRVASAPTNASPALQMALKPHPTPGGLVEAGTPTGSPAAGPRLSPLQVPSRLAPGGLTPPNLSAGAKQHLMQYSPPDQRATPDKRARRRSLPDSFVSRTSPKHSPKLGPSPISASKLRQSPRRQRHFMPSGAAGPGDFSSSSDSDSDADDGRRKFILHIDNEADEDTMALLVEPRFTGFFNTPLQRDEIEALGLEASAASSRMLTFVRRVKWGDNTAESKLNQELAAAFQDVYASLLYKSRGFACNIKSQLNLTDENEIEIVMTAVALPALARRPALAGRPGGQHSLLDDAIGIPAVVLPPPAADAKSVAGDVKMGGDAKSDRADASDEKEVSNGGDKSDRDDKTSDSGGKISGGPQNAPGGEAASGETAAEVIPRDDAKLDSEENGLAGEFLLPKFVGPVRDATSTPVAAPRPGSAGDSTAEPRLVREIEAELRRGAYAHVQVSTLEYLPRRRVAQYLGRVNIHFIRESFEEKQGTLGRFTHELLAQINTIARAHVSARGGNALLSYTLLEYQVDKERASQSYSIMSLSGDAVLLADPLVRGAVL